MTTKSQKSVLSKRQPYRKGLLSSSNEQHELLRYKREKDVYKRKKIEICSLFLFLKENTKGHCKVREELYENLKGI